MKTYWALALFACLVLSGAAVWMGGLNQDEGWYLYAANLVAEGEMPYRDFFFTQGPLLPLLYAPFAAVWKAHGLLGARLFTLSLGLLSVLISAALAFRLVSDNEKKRAAFLVVLFLLATNLYHLYYLAIPKTYALASLFVALAFYLLSFLDPDSSPLKTVTLSSATGLALAFAAGVRLSLGILLAVVGLWLLGGAVKKTLPRAAWILFGFFGALGLFLVYGPFFVDATARAGFFAALGYHKARGGSDIIWLVGSLSRLVRWYVPLFVALGFGLFTNVSFLKTSPFVRLLLGSFLAVFLVQISAPFPYEDYQVPVMLLLAVIASSLLVSSSRLSVASSLLLVLGLSFATSFGSPLLEKWTTNGQDRFWTRKKASTELKQLQEAAWLIEAIDPKGTRLLTQDLYLAVETNRKVPKGLEMGPFAILTDEAWRALLREAPKSYPVAALSGYSFAIDPPVCHERAFSQQLDYWKILKESYVLVSQEEAFGQNATPLLILKRK